MFKKKSIIEKIISSEDVKRLVDSERLDLVEKVMNHSIILKDYNKSNIKVFLESDEIKKLDLGYNKISDISVFERVDFKELAELYLYDNNISNIKVLEKAKFQNLKLLDLTDNKIKNNSLISTQNLNYEIKL